MQDAMKYVIGEEDDVECSACEVWTTCGRVGVDGLMREEVSRMDVFCMKCMYRMMSEMRGRVSAYEQRVDELEETIKTLSTLVEGSLNVSQNNPKKPEEEKTPKRRVRRRNGHRAEKPDAPEETATARSFSDVLQTNTQGSRNSSDDESTIPRSTTSQQESEGSGLEDSGGKENEDDSAKSSDQDFKTVNRRRGKKRSINIIGDSMVRNVTKIIKCGQPGSGCVARGGAGIKEIMKMTGERSKSIKDDGYLIIQG